MSTWFITGCSTGIGHAAVEAVARRGHTVVATARRLETLDDLVAAHPGLVVPLALDVTDDASVDAAVSAALAAVGPIDVWSTTLVSATFRRSRNRTPDDVRAMMDVNFWGAARVTTALLPHFRERRAGHILTVSSIAGVRGSAGLGYYCATKFAVSGFMEALAAEVGHLGIKVTLIEPGPVRSLWIPSGGKKEEILPDYEYVMRPFWERITGCQGSNRDRPRRWRRPCSRWSTPGSPRFTSSLERTRSRARAPRSSGSRPMSTRGRT